MLLIIDMSHYIKLAHSIEGNKGKKRDFSELNQLKPDFSNIVKVHMEFILLGCSQPARIVDFFLFLLKPFLLAQYILLLEPKMLYNILL